MENISSSASHGSSKMKLIIPATLLFLSMNFGLPQEAHGQNNKPKATTELMQTGAAIRFAKANVVKYYPDMQGHLDSLLTKFWDQEQQDTVSAILDQMQDSISDPQQQVGATIFFLDLVHRTPGFAGTHGKDLSLESIKQARVNYMKYMKRSKGYMTRLKEQANKITMELEQSKLNLEQSKVNLEKNITSLRTTISKFAVGDVEKYPELKAMLLHSESTYQQFHIVTTAHEQELFAAAHKE